jgi:hypothetical protein
MAALCYCRAAAPPLRISRTVFDCAEGSHAPLDSRPRNAVCRALRLKKDKAKSTAFLVAQIFLCPLQKYPAAIRLDTQSCRK